MMGRLVAFEWLVDWLNGWIFLVDLLVDLMYSIFMLFHHFLQGYSTLTCSMGDDGRPGWNRALPSCQGNIE